MNEIKQYERSVKLGRAIGLLAFWSGFILSCLLCLYLLFK